MSESICKLLRNIIRSHNNAIFHIYCKYIIHFRWLLREYEAICYKRRFYDIKGKKNHELLLETGNKLIKPAEILNPRV